MTLTLILFVVLLFAFIGLTLMVLIHLDRQRRRHVARLRRIRPDESTLETPKRKRGRVETTGIFAKIEAQLVQTNLRVSIVELLVQVFVGVLALFALLVFAFRMSPLLALPIAIIVPLALAGLIVRVSKARYRAAFTDRLPESLDIFARGLRAGRPVADSIGIVVETSTGPIHDEFARCHSEIKMGKTLPDSLARLEERVPTAEVSFSRWQQHSKPKPAAI